MKPPRLILIGLACMASCSALALSNCSTSVSNLVFGSYNSLNLLPTDSVANISITCSGATGEPVSLSIRLSAGNSGNVGLRSMLLGSNALRYNLYSNAARNFIWGDGNANTNPLVDSYSLPTPTTTRNYPIYGRIFARQAVPLGNYTDTIIVTVSY